MATTINNTTTGVTTTPDATGNLAIQTNGVTALTIDHNQIVTFANALTLTVDAAAVVTSAAQPAITSVGTLTGLTVTNPISGSVNGSAATVTGATQSAITTVGTLTNLSVAGNAVINGNLIVVGLLDRITSNVMAVTDPMIYMAVGNPTDSLDIGILGSYNEATTEKHTGFIRDASDGTWKLFHGVTAEPSTVIDFTGAIYCPLHIGGLTATTGTFSSSISATTFTGNVTGSLTGNVTGHSDTATSSGTAATVTDAAQTAITSVGTLTGLTVTNPISGSVTGSAATVTTAAQPAITSVGTLTGLTMGGTLNLVANGLTTTPVAFTSGSLLTSPVTGAMEYDGTLFYATPVASSRNVLVEEQTMYLTSTLTLVSQTAAQPMFKGAAGSTNGALTLPAGNYAFECFYNLSVMASSSGSFGFALAGTATFTQNWQTMGAKAANLVTAASPQVTYNTAANATIVTASTATAGWAKVTGAIRVSVGGTIIPSVSLGAAAAAVVGIGSYFRIRPTGAGGFVGNWS